MKDELIEQFSTNFLLLIPLLQKKIFDTISVEGYPLVRLSQLSVRVLVILHEIRRSTLSDLSEQLNVTKSNISPLVDKLVKQGLVSRHSCEDDRRLVIFEITDKGDWLCNEYHRVISNNIKDFVGHLNESDMAELNIHMDRLKTILFRT